MKTAIAALLKMHGVHVLECVNREIWGDTVADDRLGFAEWMLADESKGLSLDRTGPVYIGTDNSVWFAVSTGPGIGYWEGWVAATEGTPSNIALDGSVKGLESIPEIVEFINSEDLDYKEW